MIGGETLGLRAGRAIGVTRCPACRFASAGPLAEALALVDKAGSFLPPKRFMPRKLFHLTLAAARKRDLVADWAKLGFTVDAARGCFTLADGVTIDFFAPDSAARPARPAQSPQARGGGGGGAVDAAAAHGGPRR